MSFLQKILKLLRSSSIVATQIETKVEDAKAVESIDTTEGIADDTPAVKNMRAEVEQYLEKLSQDPPDGASYECPHGISCIEYEMFALSWSYGPSSEIQSYFVDLFKEDESGEEQDYGMACRVQLRWVPGDHGIAHFVSAWREKYEEAALKPYLEYLKTTADPVQEKPASNILSLVPDETDADCAEGDVEDEEKVN